MKREKIEAKTKDGQQPITRVQEEQLNRGVEPKLRLVNKSRDKPAYQSKFAQTMEKWADQLDAEIEMIKKL